MWFIINKEISWYFRNPIYYIGAILVFLVVYGQCQYYLEGKPFTQNAIIETLPIEKLGDADIFDGYLPADEEEAFNMSLENLAHDLINSVGLSQEETNSLIYTIKEQNMSEEQAISFIEKKYEYLSNVQSYFAVKEEMKKGSVEELNSYINNALKDENYSDYFGRKYSDYLGVAIFFYALILLAFLVIHDYKKDIYELLHTKPIKPWKYVIGKTLGGILSICFVVFVITLIFDVMVFVKGNSVSFPVDVLDMWYYVGIYNIPIIFYIGFMYIFIASLFGSPLPAIPILLLQGIYSNLGIIKENGIYGYIHKPFSVMIRFPEKFFETSLEKMQYMNQVFLILITIVFAYLAIYQWNRRRLY